MTVRSAAVLPWWCPARDESRLVQIWLQSVWPISDQPVEPLQSLVVVVVVTVYNVFRSWYVVTMLQSQSSYLLAPQSSMLQVVAGAAILTLSVPVFPCPRH